MKLSVVIPARDEAEAIGPTVESVADTLETNSIPFEIIVVDDGSSDNTAGVVTALGARNEAVRLVTNTGPRGFGVAVRRGLDQAQGDAIAVVMADNSDSPDDLVRCYQKLTEGYDCAFGSRFIKGSKVHDYPIHKLLINRLANWFIMVLFGTGYNDTTNAFKCYRRAAIEGMQPLISSHFNLTVEMPLKAMIRGFSYDVLPISWTNRATGFSKLKIKEMGSRYLFIVLYLWLEKHLSRGDYLRKPRTASKKTLDRPTV